MSNPHRGPGARMGLTQGFDTLSLPHYGAFDIRLCQIPTIASLSPEGGGVVGQYIDRCIIWIRRVTALLGCFDTNRAFTLLI